MMNMMKNYKNRLFLANHGKRSIAMDEPSDLEEFIDPSLDEEMLSKLFFSAPNSFFFLPKPMGRGFNSKRGGNFQALSRPNGFMFPSMKGKRNMEIYVRPNGFLFPKGGKRAASLMVGRNPNGFNFPMGKRYPYEELLGSMVQKRAFQLDLDDEAGNFFGQRGKRDYSAEDLPPVSPYKGRFFVSARG